MRQGIATLNNVYKIYNSETGEALDGAVSIELPNFELPTEEYNGAGVAGAINVPAPGNMSALTATITFPVIYGSITKLMELGKTKTLDLRNEVLVTNTSNHGVEKVQNRWILKGPLSGANAGSIEKAAAGEASVVMQIYYAHHWLDGDDILEWDPFKFIFKVNGDDLMAETRQNVLVN
jgi:P2 family phage contractile tail tube protein